MAARSTAAAAGRRLLAALLLALAPPRCAGELQIWATEEKIWREELRSTDARASSLWSPEAREVRLSAARNEVISFGLVLEARGEAVSDVEVDFRGLPGLRARPRGAPMSDGSELFDWRQVEVELFYVRYLEVRGMGREYPYDERLLPPRMQRPWTPGHQGAGVGEGTWADRPGANKHWPEIAVPLELHPRFNISANQSQMIWVDIYVPHGACAGERRGPLTVSVAGFSSNISVALRVRRFDLPDEPTSKTMLPYEGGDILRRYTGQNWVHCTKQHTTRALFDRHYQLAWRHKVAMVGGSFDACLAKESPKHDEPHPFVVDRLSGKTFSYAHNYTGPGEKMGVGVFPVGLYGSWVNYWGKDEEAMKLHSKRWVEWFKNAKTPLNETEIFLYLIDESHNYTQTETWAQWVQGTGLPGFATLPYPAAVNSTPSLDIACSTIGFASTERYEAALAAAAREGRPKLWMYNGGRPAAGGFAIEEEASAPRSIPWAMYKKKVHRYFYWMSTYYTNYQAGEADIDVFNRARTFGSWDSNDTQKGETGWMYGNGDGVLMYPGTDLRFNESNYGVPGPFAGLRLKYWRRGLQDVEYLELLRKRKGEAAVREMLQRLVPKVLWEVDVPDPNDPSWARTNTSWPEAWDEWEKVRLEIADALEALSPEEPPCTPKPRPPEPAPASEPCHPTGGALEWQTPGGGSVRVWATEEKVLREERWATCSASETRSHLWDGGGVNLVGARNEVVSFALVLEAAPNTSGLQDVRVRLPRIGRLRSRGNVTREDRSDRLFDWRDTQIELFYVRYLQIRGLSGNREDERLWPRRMQRPWMAASGGGGVSSGTWKDRPGADKHWPEIAVPLELHEAFNVTAGESQMIWVDVYLPRDLEAQDLTGDLQVQIGGGAEHTVPVRLKVWDFALPDSTASRTMVPIEGGDILRRFIGQNWVHCSVQESEVYRRLWERHWQVAWRHRIQLVGGSFDGCKNYQHYMGEITGDLEVLKDQPEQLYIERMNGSTFTPARNYSGPGENQSCDIFPLGLYGSWSRRKWDERNGTNIGMQAGFEYHLNNWERWFTTAAPPKVAEADRFFYLIDESENYAQTEEWAAMCKAVTGPGSAIPTFATINLLHAVNETPSLAIACSTISFAPTKEWEAAFEKAKALGMELWLYNGGRPAHGMTNTEGEATDWRTIPWALRKRNVPLYFYWMSTYYTNYQAGEGAVNVFQRARTFGIHGANSTTDGEEGWMYGNGDGVLLYPGTDFAFPNESYDVWGPFVSLRMKYWRRGLQDVEYIELFKQRCGEEAAQAYIQRMMPKALWEVGDKKWYPEISWPQDWDAWEGIRRALGNAIAAGRCDPPPPLAALRAGVEETTCMVVSDSALQRLAARGFAPVTCKR